MLSVSRKGESQVAFYYPTRRTPSTRRNRIRIRIETGSQVGNATIAAAIERTKIRGSSSPNQRVGTELTGLVERAGMQVAGSCTEYLDEFPAPVIQARVRQLVQLSADDGDLDRRRQTQNVFASDFVLWCEHLRNGTAGRGHHGKHEQMLVIISIVPHIKEIAMTYRPRQLGSTTVSPLGLGCMGMTLAYGVPDTDEAVATLRRAIELGVTHFDTADMYGNGANEKLLGRHLAAHKDTVTIATKTGIRTLPGVGLPRGVDGSPAYIKRAADRSLKRLGTDRIDLYYLHRVDPDVPIEDSIGAMSDLVEAGKVRDIGVSEVTGDQLRRAYATHPIAAVQMEWSVFTREPEREVLPVADQLNVAVVAYSPLGRGMLTGAAAATTDLPVLDFRRTLPRWNKANLDRNLKSVATVRQIAAAHDATAGQIALAWLLARTSRVLPIPGTKRRKYLEENLGAQQLCLSSDEIAALDELVAAGMRYKPGTGVPGAE